MENSGCKMSRALESLSGNFHSPTFLYWYDKKTLSAHKVGL